MKEFLEHIFGVSVVRGLRAGDLVTITDIGQVYTNYSQMMKRHPQYALRWVYKGLPKSDDTYRILQIYPHCMANSHDKNDYCVIIQNTLTQQIYMIGEYALEYVDSDKRK